MRRGCGRECWAGRLERAVREKGGVGPWALACWAVRGERVGWARRGGRGGAAGPLKGLGWVEVSNSFLFSYFKLTQTTQLFEFKNKFEFNPSTQTKEQCTSMNAQAC